MTLAMKRKTVVALICCCLKWTSSVKVAHFQKSGTFSAASHMIRTLSEEDLNGSLEAYTLCARFSLLHERGSSSMTFFSLGNELSDNFIKGGLTPIDAG